MFTIYLDVFKENNDPVTESKHTEKVRVQRKETGKSTESQGMGKKHYFELLNKLNEIDTSTMKRIIPLEKMLDIVLKDTKSAHHQLNRITVDINNKGSC